VEVFNVKAHLERVHELAHLASVREALVRARVHLDHQIDETLLQADGSVVRSETGHTHTRPEQHHNTRQEQHRKRPHDDTPPAQKTLFGLTP